MKGMFILQKYKSIEELKGTQKCKIKYFAFYYDNSCLIYKEAKYGVSYWLQELSLNQFKGILEDGKNFYNLGINPDNIDMCSDIKAIQYIYFVERARRTLQATLKEIKMGNLFETPKDIEADTETVIDNLVMGIETLLNIMTITL